MNELKVLARAKPIHKYMIVEGLKQMGSNVVVTGEGINDVNAILAADVGLAMGSGCSAVKETSDVILTNDDFEATIKSIMWGRNIYNNIARFLQFQVTVNLSALMTICIGSIILAESPFSAVQLLWINLIMDTFAAFALATEPPTMNVLQDKPWKEDVNVMKTEVWG